MLRAYLLIITSIYIMDGHSEIPDKKLDTIATNGKMSSKNGDESFVQEKDFTFPTTLEGFGYKFNNDGKLVDAESGQPFVFNIHENPIYNQLRYEKIGEVLNLYVYELLESEANLTKVYLPVDATKDEPRTFIFMSKDAMQNQDKLLVLVHGSGVVRAGQWARRLIINDCLDSGTQLPYIKRAQEEGYSVIVLNTNDNFRTVDSHPVPIRGNEKPVHHIRYVWDHFISKSIAKQIFFVAHSYGGVALIDLAVHRLEGMKSSVIAVAFTDSVHFLFPQLSPSVVNWIHNVGRDWVTSKEPLDTPIPDYRSPKDVSCVSAGHTKHEMTSWSSFSSIFDFFSQKIKDQEPHDEL